MTNNNLNIFEEYIQSISSKFSHEETSELGYRTDLEILLKNIFESIKVKRIDHDPKAKQRNKPDFIVLNNDTPILYMEVKDIGVSLDKIEKSEQMTRYYGYTNLVLSDYLEFRFYRNGLKYGEPIKIAKFNLKDRTITPISESYINLAKTLLDFTQSQKEPIRSGIQLSKIMAGRARRIRDNIREFLAVESERNNELVRVYETIKKLLVHDLSKDSFADMYAQTLVYGLFAARYFDESQGNFSRQEARDLIPKSNPFLRDFFDHIVGPNFDKRLEYIVDELCEVFSHANIAVLMKEYYSKDLWGKNHSGPDPVIHFYEDFLKEYDPDLRRKMGAYYTPIPVVQFIVRSVDYLLKNEFSLSGGLSDTSKTADGLHKVQILDPAVGTGTFISKIIRNIYEHLKKTGQDGRWHPYVLHDLLPRLYGFELMMTPYTIAHLKLSIAFKDTGFKYFNNERLGIYLTNSLEESSIQQDLFAFGLAESIAEESKEATKIKNEKPIMVVMGNPPYSVSSSNKGEWIQNLIKDYKRNLNEKKINLDDDYIKFIRFAEHFIEKNKTGIVAMITNNSFIDGATHRQMRKHLLETFDDIYILNLHGSTKKKEKAEDGSVDENVFSIEQGVSINIFVRKNMEKKNLANVYHSEIFGKRKDKLKILDENELQNFKWHKLIYTEPYYFFVPKDFKGMEKYEEGFKIDELFFTNSSGIETQKDSLVIQFNHEELNKVRFDIESSDTDQVQTKYKIKDSRDWNLKDAKRDLANASDTKILYRPFDVRWTFYSGKTKGVLAYPRDEVMRHLVKQNLALLVAKRVTSFPNWQHVFLSKNISERCTVSLQTGEVGYVFPLHLYTTDGSPVPNLKKEIVDKIEIVVGKTTPEDVFDYVYAVLHSPIYKKEYNEFLKIDFPRIPYPKDRKNFRKTVALGNELRRLHLLESPKVNQFITTYPIDGSNVIEKIIYKDGKVFINESQYFGGVPESVWEFYVGGYQPAQKWLKDRKDGELTNEEIEHYQKIIVSVLETMKIMKEIENIKMD